MRKQLVAVPDDGYNELCEIISHTTSNRLGGIAGFVLAVGRPGRDQMGQIVLRGQDTIRQTRPAHRRLLEQWGRPDKMNPAGAGRTRRRTGTPKQAHGKPISQMMRDWRL